MAHLLYINKTGTLKELESTEANDQHTFTFDEENFIVALFKDGKRQNSSVLTLLEQYQCTSNGDTFGYTDGDFQKADRVLVIPNNLFFLTRSSDGGVSHTHENKIVLDLITQEKHDNWQSIVSLPVPFLLTPSSLFVAKNSNTQMTIGGAYFTPATTVTVGNQQVTNLQITPSQVAFNLITDNVNGSYNIVVTNERGSTTYPQQLVVSDQTIIVPDAPNWESVGTVDDFFYSLGGVSPNSLNTNKDRRIKGYRIEPLRNFTLKFKISLIQYGNNYGSTFGVTHPDNLNQVFMGVHAWHGSAIQMHVNEVNQIHYGHNYDDFVFIDRHEGLLTMGQVLSGSDITRYTKPDTYNGELFLGGYIPNHAQATDMELTLKI